MKALLFDCDGVIADTERDGHRVAFNRAFTEAGLAVDWDVPRYGQLLRVAGGKERLRHFFDTHGWPVPESDRDWLIARLHALKTEQFRRIVAAGELPARPGVGRIVDEADAAGIRLAVCSTSHEKAVTSVVEHALGSRRYIKFSGIYAGDVVPAKKPAPDIYLLAARKLGLAPADCLVIEDSRNGLLAAQRAGMPCLVTTSSYTRDEDFAGAARVVPELGDPPGAHLTLDQLRTFAAAARAA